MSSSALGHLKHMQVDELRQAFDALDSKNCGTITVSETTKCLDRLGCSVDRAELQSVIEEVQRLSHSRVGSKQSYTVTKDEFVQIMTQLLGVYDLKGGGTVDKLYRAAFNSWRHSDGTISDKELRRILLQQSGTNNVSLHSVQGLLESLGARGGESISEQQFVDGLMKSR
eukprot:GHVR01113071.1.p1 GENE.GHVR01113071.1~~GHVR01113071.1.p1  ORF type:complete len:170 (+),score=23.02 GHVR01113071.1:52-561(+)